MGTIQGGDRPPHARAYELYLGKTRTDLTPADTVTFQSVGDENPKTRGLSEIDRIVLG